MIDADLALALAALVAFAVATAAVGGVSIPFLAFGALATVAFEAVALRHRERVRTVWERPIVRFGALGIGLALAVVGALVGVDAVVAGGLGALGTYVLLKGLLATGVLGANGTAERPER